ncbi:MAG: biotin--[acetyl-CoA-carboxylase] ligase [Chloroflexi bacterium RBG_16_54_11]|nr:MAG: biotin--[acetyl-CoA-carboxylase] ligase [Chloroflexi bacterium RBG_16_54_11]
MDQLSIESALADLHLPALRYNDRLDSTNAEAWRWLEAGGPDRALLVADEQTAGRGRAGRHWVTASGSALAFSLLLLAPPLDPQRLPRLTGLGALSVVSALEAKFALPAWIKWPNDILVDGRKVGGVLVEALWSGEKLEAAVVGIGINIAPESVSAAILPPAGLNYPATCVEDATGYPVDRLEVLHAILHEMLVTWLSRLSLPEFMHAWEAKLAFLDQWVELSAGGPLGMPGLLNRGEPGSKDRLAGRLVGLTEDGALKLIDMSGKLVSVAVGELHLRPALIKDSTPPE